MRIRTVAIIMLAMACAGQAAASTFASGKLHYRTLPQAGQVEVIRAGEQDNSAYEGVVIVPQAVYYDGQNYAVTGIGDSAFAASRITEAVLPNSVTRIGRAAFANASLLHDVTLPLHITTVPAEMLQGTAVEAVAVPDGVTAIGDRAFDSCTRLKSVFLPATVASLGKGCFNDCYNLETMTLAAAVPPAIGDDFTLNGVQRADVVVPQGDAVEAYTADSLWNSPQQAFRIYSSENVDLFTTLEGEDFENGWQRVELPDDFGYKIYDSWGELVAVTAASCCYLPVLDHNEEYSIVPTNMIDDSQPISCLVQSSGQTITAGVEEKLAAVEPNIYVIDGTIYITGDNHGTWTRVWDMYGMLYYERPSNDGHIGNLPRNRVYIVQVGKTAKKVFL